MLVDPVIQSRVRQLLGLRGGPAIVAEEAVMPVAVIAGYPQDRQPQLESGDMLVRRFSGLFSQAPVADQFATVGLRVAAADTLLWLTKIYLTGNALASSLMYFGRTGPQVAATFGALGWHDMRLSGGNLDGLITLFALSAAATAVGFNARLPVWVRVAETVVVDVDFVLVDDPQQGLTNNINCVIVQNQSVGQSCLAGFEGIAFTRAR